MPLYPLAISRPGVGAEDIETHKTFHLPHGHAMMGGMLHLPGYFLRRILFLNDIDLYEILRVNTEKSVKTYMNALKR